MNAYIPNDWMRVHRDQFKRYLETCNDYRTDGYANGIVYYFTHNGQRFAIDCENGTVMVDSSLLQPPTTP